MTLSKKNYHNNTNSRSHPIVNSYNVISKQKIKMKTQNTLPPLCRSKVTSTQNNGVPFFSCLGYGV